MVGRLFETVIRGVIPPSVEQFLSAHVPTIAHLEALLLLRSEPQVAWTVPLLAARLFVTPEQATRVLAGLVAHGLAAPPDASQASYRYAPGSAALAAQVDEAAEIYRTRLVAVTQFIHARQSAAAPASTGVQQFADAFRLRKD